MNKIKSNIIAVVLLTLMMGMISCSESFLDVESKTESTTGTSYKNEKMSGVH